MTSETPIRRAVILFSGGLDSSTTLAIAKQLGFTCHALTVRYGQLHEAEIEAATKTAHALGVADHRILALDLASLAASALTRDDIAVPHDRTMDEISRDGDIPSTYVPARNTVMLSLALAWAETLGASDIFLGVNVLDASGYPDCRPAFVDAFAKLANVATASGARGETIEIHAPLIEMTKAEIIKRGLELGVDYSLTHSCYSPGTEGGACGRCDACLLRKKGFADAGVADPTRYF